MNGPIKMIFNVSKEINSNFKPVWVSNNPYNVLKGGRNSFKSSVISMKLVRDMLLHISKGRKANVIVLRKVASNIRDTVFQQIQWAIRKYGLDPFFKVTVAPFKITHIKSGSTFYFYGQDDVQKLKGNAVDEIIAVWYEEAAEFDGYEDFDQNFATFARQKAAYVDFVKFYWSYNPPRNPYSWINEWTDDLKNEPDYLVHESSYLDDELGFVTNQMLDEINRIKVNDHDYYRYLYLGEPVGLGTNVYNFELFNKILELPKDERIIWISIGLDTGHQQSATAGVAVGYTNKKNVVILDTLYYSPKGKSRKKAPDELSQLIHDFIEKIKAEYGMPIYRETIDSAEGAIRNQYYKDFNVRWHPISKKKKVTMIDYVVTLLAQGRVFYLDKPENKVFEEQHKQYMWNEKTIHSDNPKVVEVDDHVPDAFQYFVNDHLDELGLIW